MNVYADGFLKLNKWLGMDNNPYEWEVVYHATGLEFVNAILSHNLNIPELIAGKR